jgi:KDO2-lipid IV(A) lauroyltransferase
MLSLMRWVASWPLSWVHAVGAAVGWLAWGLSPSYRRRLDENARQAGLDAAQRRAAVGQAGRMSLEVPWIWFRSPHKSFLPLMIWVNAELVDRAVASGKGLLLLTPHVGSFEVAGRAYAERWGAQKPMTALYRPSKQQFLARWQTFARDLPGLHSAPANLMGVRQLLRALRRGEAVGLLPDQVPPLGQGVWAPFFGRRAYTMTLAARLASQTGCVTLLTWCERLPAGQGFRMTFRELPEPIPLQADDGSLDERCAEVINRAMESVIAECPSQFLWGYNRYKGPRSVPAEGSEA